MSESHVDEDKVDISDLTPVVRICAGQTGEYRDLRKRYKTPQPFADGSGNPPHAAPLTEMVLLGNLAVWVAESGSGPKIEWDAKNLAARNVPHLEKLIKPEYRQGYSI